MRFFVLGSSGFVGRVLVRNLRHCGYELYAPCSTDINLTDSKSIKKLSKLYQHNDHLIILSGIAPYRGNDSKAFVDNMKMAKNISESINDKVAHILYVSSDAVYGTKTFNVDEKSQLAPDSFYGEMHLAREKVFENFKDRIGVLRPTLVFGKNDPHNAYGPNRFLRSAFERNEITIFGKGEELRDYIEVSELCFYLTESSKKKYSGVLNIVSGKSTRFIEIANLITKLRPSTKILFEERTIELRHRKYDNRKLNKIFETTPKTISYHIKEYIRGENEKN
jgi:UDP-glucose 4-epimerase